ncbi:MAG TPA: glycerophosphodiester phosphodiesterase [Gaiellaceae bacterium]|nr:glycerophosphodiester phosphodiesterase [Gaiellaceae bacterium]
MISLERRDGRPLRIGHRGAALLAPENTLAAFRAAIEVGVDLVELDVFRISSGELVIAHSNDLREVSHGAASGTVRDLVLDELRASSPDLPTFAEALEYFATEAADTGLHVDLKERGIAAEIASELRRFGLVERSFVSGFYRRALREIRRHEPGVRTGVTFPRDPLRIHGRRGAGLVERAALRSLRAVTPALVRPLLAGSDASALVLHHTVVGPAVVRRAHARGVAVVAWTVDDPGDLARVDAAGVDAVVSNDPRIFLSTLPS